MLWLTGTHQVRENVNWQNLRDSGIRIIPFSIYFLEASITKYIKLFNYLPPLVQFTAKSLQLGCTPHVHCLLFYTSPAEWMCSLLNTEEDSLQRKKKKVSIFIFSISIHAWANLLSGDTKKMVIALFTVLGYPPGFSTGPGRTQKGTNGRWQVITR